MSDSSPSDLAVAFRALPRRLREAQGVAPATATSSFLDRSRAVLERSGHLLHTAADPMMIADAIDAVPADEWDETVLTELRQHALELGHTIRDMEAAVEALGGEDD